MEGNAVSPSITALKAWVSASADADLEMKPEAPNCCARRITRGWSFDEMTTTMYFDSTIDLPGVYLEPYGFALSGKHNTYGTDGLTWSVSDPTIADLDEYSKTTLVANKDGKSGDVTVTAEYQGMTASFTVHVGPYPGSVELYHA